MRASIRFRVALPSGQAAQPFSSAIPRTPYALGDRLTSALGGLANRGGRYAGFNQVDNVKLAALAFRNLRQHIRRQSGGINETNWPAPAGRSSAIVASCQCFPASSASRHKVTSRLRIGAKSICFVASAPPAKALQTASGKHGAAFAALRGPSNKQTAASKRLASLSRLKSARGAGGAPSRQPPEV